HPLLAVVVVARDARARPPGLVHLNVAHLLGVASHASLGHIYGKTAPLLVGHYPHIRQRRLVILHAQRRCDSYAGAQYGEHHQGDVHQVCVVLVEIDHWSGGLGFGACCRDVQRPAHHDVEVPGEDQVGDEHEGAPDCPPGPVAPGGDHRVDEGH